MFRRVSMFSLLACALVSHTTAAEAETIQAHLPINGDRVSVALRFVQSHFETFGVTTAVLRLHSITELKGGAVIRFGQFHGSLPIASAGVSVVIIDHAIALATGQLRTVNGVTKGKRIGLEAAKRALLERKPNAKVSRAQLALRLGQPLARPVWVLQATTLSPPDVLRVEIDAIDGRIRRGVSIARHARFSVKGMAYMHNPATGTLEQVTLQGLNDESLILDGEFANVSRCGVASNGQELDCDRQATLGDDGSYLHIQPEEPSVEDAFAEVHTYFHVDTFHRWLQDRFEFKRRREDQKINVYVNFHFIGQDGQLRGMSNAFFGDLDGDGIGDLVFGQAARDFAYDADVVYHEFTHSVVDETSGLRIDFDNLGLNVMPAALNEAFADLMSSAYVGDGQVGEYAGGSYGSMSIRNLDGAPLHCPSDLIGESHSDGLIWGRLNWAIRARVSDKLLYDQVLYAALAGVHETSDFADAAKVLSGIAAAKDSALALIVDEEVKRFGLDHGCDRIVELKEGNPRYLYLFEAFDRWTPAPLQYRIDVPNDAKAMRIYFTTINRRGDPSNNQVVGGFVRKGTPVDFSSRDPQRDFTVPESQGVLALEVGNQENPLDPGQSYYVIPLNVSEQISPTFELKVEFDRQSLPLDGGATADSGLLTSDAGAPQNPGSQDPNQSSSGCSIGASPRPLGSILVLFAVLFFVSRKRRAR